MFFEFFAQWVFCRYAWQARPQPRSCRIRRSGVHELPPGNTWQDQQREELDSLLAGAQIKYFYLDTKRNEAGGQVKAAGAWVLYQHFQPDALITADNLVQARGDCEDEKM